MKWTHENTPERLRAILAGIRRSQAQLARVLGVNPVTVSRWVTGKSKPDPRSRFALEKLEKHYARNRECDTSH